MDELERRLREVAAVLNGRALAPDIEVLVETRWQGPFRTQGLCAYNLSTDVFEPVRRRSPWATRWEPRQSPEQAALNIECFLAHRPDLSEAERPRHDDVKGTCPACRHAWTEHVRPAVEVGEGCSECQYEIDHDEAVAPDLPCGNLPPPLNKQ